jgi:NADH:ubiquinone oxidoreductase subunit E
MDPPAGDGGGEPHAPGACELLLCMGSACHQIGVYQVLPRLQELLDRHAPGGAVALKGAFCLDACAEGIVLKYGARLVLHVNPRNVAERFEREVLPYLPPPATPPAGGGDDGGGA